MIIILLGTSWSWLYGSWIYNYLYNQCLSPLNKANNMSKCEDLILIRLWRNIKTTNLLANNIHVLTLFRADRSLHVFTQCYFVALLCTVKHCDGSWWDLLYLQSSKWTFEFTGLNQILEFIFIYICSSK
jgi:hypothetical protein